MLFAILRTLLKVAVASLVVGTILGHFGVTADQILRAAGLSVENIEDVARRGLAWALPNVALGAMVIVPIWFLIYLFRPPGGQRSGE